MNRFLTLAVAAVLAGSALAQVGASPSVAVKGNARPRLATRPAQNADWNPKHQVVFKGSISGMQVSSPQEDGKRYVQLLVKLENGGVAMVELGPNDYVEAQGLNLRMRAPIWVAGAKTSVSAGSMIVAQRVNYDGARPAFRQADGSPLWQWTK